MYRFFKKLTSFGVENLAISILYGIKDDWFKRSKDESYRSYPDKIANFDQLIEYLSRAILSVLDFVKYKNLNGDKKKDVQSLLISVLSEISRDYGSVDKKTGAKTNGLLITYVWVELEDSEFSYWGMQDIQFPTDLFCNLRELQKCIVSALLDNNFDILKQDAFLFNLPPQYGLKIIELRKNSRLIAQGQRDKNSFFSLLPDEINEQIALLSVAPVSVPTQEIFKQLFSHYFQRPLQNNPGEVSSILKSFSIFCQQNNNSNEKGDQQKTTKKITSEYSL